MELQEMIKLDGKPFPEPLPRSAGELIKFFQAKGLSFEDLYGILVFRSKYQRGRLEMVNKLLAQEKLDLTVMHGVWPEFDKEDFQRAPLWTPIFPEISVDEVDFSVKCDTCGKERVVVDPAVRVEEMVGLNKRVVSVNGQFEIVRSDVRESLANELTGAAFSPFDRAGNYFYFLAERTLSPLIIHEDEAFDLGGECPKCSMPRFRMFFGPLRYPRDSWLGDDVVYSDFNGGNVYTPKAFKILQRYEKKLVRDGIVLLE